MKTWANSLWSISLIFSILIFTGCSDNDENLKEEKNTFVLSSENIDLMLNNTTVYTEVSGKKYEIAVATQDNVSWHIDLEKGSEFAVVEPEGDKTGSGSVKITIPANLSFEERRATVVISCSTTKSRKEITFVQEAKVDKTFHFAVMGDLHYGLTSKGGSIEDRVPPAIQYITQNYPDVKAFFLVGDVTNNGTREQFTGIRKMVEKNLPDNGKAYFMMGNHDLWSGGKENFSECIGQPKNQYIEKNGYPFITLSIDKDVNPYYEETSVNFLKEHLAKAAKTYPGKPIFVFAHVPPKHTTWGDTWECTDNEDVHNELSKYPQAIFFTGHTHFTIEDERSITQNKYTWINAGPSHYGVLSLAITPGVNAYRTSGNWINEALVVDVDEESNVTVTRLNTREKKAVEKKWFINAPHNGSQFKYTYPVNGRADKDATPTMSDVSIDDIGETTCKISFQQGKDNLFVYHYKVNVIDAETKKTVSSQYVFSEFYWKQDNNYPTLSCDVNGLQPNTKYEVSVKAVDSFESESEPAVKEFTTKAMPAIDPNTEAPVADLVDVAFTDKEAKNVATFGLQVTKKGNGFPNGYNSTLRMYVTQPNTTGNTNNCYYINFKDKAIYTDGVKDGFTWEVYCKPSDIKTMQYPMSNLQGSGMGFTFNETYNEPKGETFYAMMHNGSGYKKIAFMQPGNIKANTYYHLLFTWDGERISLYTNGKYVTSEPCSKLNLTSGDKQYICIGADSNSSPSAIAQNGFKGEIAVARIYSKAVSVSEAAAIYRQLGERAEIEEFDKLDELLRSGLSTELAAEGWRLMHNLATTRDEVKAFIAKTGK